MGSGESHSIARHAVPHDARGDVGLMIRLDVTLTELHQLQDRIRRFDIVRDDYPIFGACVDKLVDSATARHERMLKKIVTDNAGRSEPLPGPVIDIDARVVVAENTPSTPPTSSEAAVSNSPAAPPPTGASIGASEVPPAPSEPKTPKGHGRNGADAFTHAKHHFHKLAAGIIGVLCAVCGVGRMSRYREKIIIRVIGQPLFGAELHHHEQARCRNCGKILRADGPPDLCEGLGSDYIRYDWSACAMLIVMHYFAGSPFKRLESLQAGWGIPMPDANQWQIADGSDDRLLPLYRALERHAIQQATNFRIDDTGSMVIALRKQISEEIAALRLLGKPTKDVRTGINATGSYWETPSGPIILFHTGRHHAGEMVDRLLRYRLVSSPKLVKCTDGASKNFDHTHGAKLVESTCNAHAFLKFRAVKDKHPTEYAEAGRIYKQVFDNDDAARALGLTSIDRMNYHRQHSRPLMEALKKMCEAKISSRLVEPNAALWEPLTFVINQYPRLVLFCEVPDVPLDTNLVEQVLIMAVRYLSGSFNYHTEDGAVVGDHAMSLIGTARANGVEPVGYLAECLRCHEDLAKRPHHYLPWVYRERMKNGSAAREAARDPPGEGAGHEPEMVRSG